MSPFEKYDMTLNGVGRQYAAMRAFDQDQGGIAGEPDATEPSVAVQRAIGTANFNRRGPAKAATNPPLPQAALPARSRRSGSAAARSRILVCAKVSAGRSVVFHGFAGTSQDGRAIDG
jgi:hypothetical protein